MTTTEAILRIRVEDAFTTFTALSGDEILQEAREVSELQLPEVIIKPSLIGLEQEGLHVATYEFVMKCDVWYHKYLWGNIELSGVMADVAAVAARLRDDLVALLPVGTVVQVRVAG